MSEVRYGVDRALLLSGVAGLAVLPVWSELGSAALFAQGGGFVSGYQPFCCGCWDVCWTAAWIVASFDWDPLVEPK